MSALLRMVVVLTLGAVLGVAQPASAFSPDEPLEDPALEERAQELNEALRCLVCQGQSIADSNAELARDLRVLVRERLAAGDSNDEVTSYLTDRYGDFILMSPPVKSATYALWFGPAAALVIGGGAVFYLFRRARARGGPSASGTPVPLSEDEQRQLDALLDDDPK